MARLRGKKIAMVGLEIRRLFGDSDVSSYSGITGNF